MKEFNANADWEVVSKLRNSQSRLQRILKECHQLSQPIEWKEFPIGKLINDTQENQEVNSNDSGLPLSATNRLLDL